MIAFDMNNMKVKNEKETNVLTASNTTANTNNKVSTTGTALATIKREKDNVDSD